MIQTLNREKLTQNTLELCSVSYTVALQCEVGARAAKYIESLLDAVGSR